MQWRWPGGLWRSASDLRQVRTAALEAAQGPPLVEIRDGPGDPAGWLLAVPDDAHGRIERRDPVDRIGPLAVEGLKAGGVQSDKSRER